MGTTTAAIPFERAVLRDGSVVHIRPIGPDDKALLEQGFEQLSAESRYRRFHHPVKRLGKRELDYFTTVDHTDHEALVALGPHGTELVGVARYVRLADRQFAEVAIDLPNRLSTDSELYSALRHAAAGRIESA